MSADLPVLSPHAARVLGVLIEKEAVTPDAYPMTHNALVAGCNQLTSREPVMSLSSEEVSAALSELAAAHLAAEVHQAGARVMKYEHRVRIVFAIERAHAVLLGLLLLRGAQTPGELRQRSERLYAWPDPQALDAALQFLCDKFPPLVERLPKAPGTKEARCVHALCGVVTQEAAAGARENTGLSGAPLAERVAALEAALAQLHAEFAAFKANFD